MRIKQSLLFMATILFSSFSIQAKVTPIPTPKAPSIAATSYILMDVKSGHIIAEYEADLIVPPASLTKIMTSYVLAAEEAAERVKPDDIAHISENAWARNFPGSSLMFIEVGDKVKIDDLHRGVIIQSGNDASVAVAEHVAGSESAFADLMNAHAKELGLSNTHYVNSTGLPHPEHMTTARDIAKLSQALIQNHPEIYKVYSEKDFTYRGIKQSNRNTLLWDKQFNVDGIKTGHTEAAGYCLATSAVQGDRRLIAVVMGTESKRARATESRKLLSYGFRFFETPRVADGGKILVNHRIWKGASEAVDIGVKEDIYLTIPRGAKSRLATNISLNKPIVAPVAAGDVLGEVTFTYDGELLYTADLVSLNTITAGSLWQRISDTVKLQFSGEATPKAPVEATEAATETKP